MCSAPQCAFPHSQLCCFRDRSQQQSQLRHLLRMNTPWNHKLQVLGTTVKKYQQTTSSTHLFSMLLNKAMDNLLFALCRCSYQSHAARLSHQCTARSCATYGDCIIQRSYQWCARVTPCCVANTTRERGVLATPAAFLCALLAGECPVECVLNQTNVCRCTVLLLLNAKL